MPEPLLIMAAIVSLALAAVGLIWYFGNKLRAAAFREFAQSLGILYREGKQQVPAELESFELFSTGRGKTARHVIEADDGTTRLLMFDYQFTTGGGKSTHTHRQTLVAIESRELDLPRFLLRPENVWDKLTGMLGFGRDIDFPTHPTFSRKYMLTGEGEHNLRRTFQPEVLDLFEANLDLHVEGAGNRLIVARAGRLVARKRFKEFFEQAFAVFTELSAKGEPHSAPLT